ncbi:hypothetical protein [Maritimibacter sp. 55A14]|uniref:hypothetical protein n=1 Tax=Maritimibacter sp. 55A14 TaxID=2174844 RepID=UPI0011B21CA7|nr:hypothetical protein [Maritimibacter sp. 55A14]
MRERLSVVNGRLVGSDGQDIEAFLAHHKGGLQGAELELFLEVFRAQLATGGLYRERCIFCHDPARDFARLNLIHRDGQLLGRYTGHDIAAFLPGHARLTEAEAARMTETLGAFLRGGR